MRWKLLQLGWIPALFLAGAATTHSAENTSPATPPPAADNAWQSCVSQLRADALAQGISAQTVGAVLDEVTKLPRVISADRSQPEFTQTFTDYYTPRVSDFRVNKGRELLAAHAPLLAQIQTATGVPAQYLVAFWGLETNFGSYFGKLSIPSALTTLACDSRRAAFFTRELIATLRIVDQGDIHQDQLIGSWAGAIGHMQFMPTTYLQHAVDGDADGRKDLIGSIDDALLSGATYLTKVGWQPGFRWGREVWLPDDFDYAQGGYDQWRPLTDWRAMGVTDVFGRSIPQATMEAALLVPAGHTGPAFLVYPNFRVIMKWNRSLYYALSVGRLADRIAGAGRLSRTPPNIKLSTQAVFDLQAQLNTLGYETGTPDGVMGTATRKGIRRFQQEHGLRADGFPSDELFDAVARQLGNAVD